MKQHVAIHKGKEALPNSLWWRPIFDWQRQVNEAMIDATPSFVSPAFWSTEERLFDTIQQNANRVFGEIFNNRQMMTPWWVGSRPKPYVDILENEDGFTVKADLSGVKAEDIDVSVSSSALIIGGRQEEDRKGNGGAYLHRECCRGRFSRTVALPEDADLGNAQAYFDPRGNILTVDVPKKEKTDRKGKRLKMEAEQKGRPVKHSEDRRVRAT